MTISLIALFCLGYLIIALERPLGINKTSAALLTGCLMWAIIGVASAHRHEALFHLAGRTSDIAGIIFFLIGAMTIVEMIDQHGGFDLVARVFRTRNPLPLVWIVGLITFFMSAVLDNMTTSIVMTSLVMKLLRDKKQQMLFACIVVIAANAGGAWSPIGDVTTTMLWIGGKISTASIIVHGFLPSLASLAVPLLILSPFVRHSKIAPSPAPLSDDTSPDISGFERAVVFFAGILLLISVPFFKMLTHLPPYMGMLFSVGILWTLSELLHRRKTDTARKKYSVASALESIDIPSALFFLGILLAVSALDEAGVLRLAADWCARNVGGFTRTASATGLLSAVIDNVPLVAAGMGMYDPSVFGQNHPFWMLLAYCAGTGGSILIIGSAAGIVAMGIARIEFFWYLRNISLLALAGYAAGIGVFLLQRF